MKWVIDIRREYIWVMSDFLCSIHYLDLKKQDIPQGVDELSSKLVMRSKGTNHRIEEKYSKTPPERTRLKGKS